jgi:hypothetical protein
MDGENAMSLGGGSSKSKSEGKSYTPEQKQWLGRALQVYGPQIGQGENVFQGNRVAGFSPLQNQSIQQAQGLLGSFSPSNGMPLFGQMGDALGQILSGQSGAPLLSLDQANDTFNQQYVNPAYRNFRMNTAPLIREEFAGPGFWSTARAGAVTDSAGDLASQLEAQRAGYLWDTEQTNRQLQEAQAGRQLTGVPLGMQYGMMPTQQAMAQAQGTAGLFDFGAQQQQLQQARIDSRIQRFAEANRITSEEDMAILLSLLGMNYSSSSGSSSSWNFGFGMNTG